MTRVGEIHHDKKSMRYFIGDHFDRLGIQGLKDTWTVIKDSTLVRFYNDPSNPVIMNRLIRFHDNGVRVYTLKSLFNKS